MAAEQKQLPCEFRRTHGISADLGEGIAHGYGCFFIGSGNVRLQQDGAEDVVEIMGHPAGKPSYGFHLLRLAELLLELIFVRDIAFHGDEVENLAIAAHNWGNRGLLLIQTAVPPPVGEMAAPDFPADQGVPHLAIECGILHSAFQYLGIQSDRFVAGIAGSSFKRWIDVLDGAGAVCDEYRFTCMFHRLGESRIGFFRAFAFRNVTKTPHPSHDFAADALRL